jgi:hypothetical protein
LKKEITSSGISVEHIIDSTSAELTMEGDIPEMLIE